jgi:chromosome segregation ATPase
VAALEAASPGDLARMEKDRIAELERQLGSLASEHAQAQRDLQRANEASLMDKQLYTAAAEREADTLKRAEEAEEAHARIAEQLADLHQKSSATESSFREHTERLITLSSVAQQREAERDQYRNQMDEAISSRDEHFGLIDQTKAAIAAAGLRAAEMEAMYNQSTNRITQLEEELSDTRAELEARSREAELATERLADVETAYAKSREEADSLRTITTGRLGELLDSHKEMRSDESRATRGHQEQLRALDEEGKSLRKMLKEAGQRVDAAEAGVATHRQRARELETAHHGLKGELRGHRTKLLSSQKELAKYRDLHAAKESELRERESAATEVEMKCIMLRNLRKFDEVIELMSVSDHGIAVNDNDLNTTEGPSTRDLETKLKDRTRAHENSQREIDELTKRCREAEDRVESLGRLVDRMKDARSPTSQSMRSPTPPHDPNGDRRIIEVERKLQEVETAHKEKLATLESDYQ